MVSADLPSGPPEAVKTMVGRAQTISHCVTPQQASDTPGELFRKSNGKCKYSSFDRSTGKLSALMQFQGGENGNGEIMMNGIYTGTSYKFTSKMKGTVQGQSMSMTSEVVGRRTGECN